MVEFPIFSSPWHFRSATTTHTLRFPLEQFPQPYFLIDLNGLSSFNSCP